MKVSGDISTYSILSFYSLEFKYMGGFSAKQAERQRERGVDLAFQTSVFIPSVKNPSGVDRTLNDSADSVCFLPPTPPKPSSSLFIIALHPRLASSDYNLLPLCRNEGARKHKGSFLFFFFYSGFLFFFHRTCHASSKTHLPLETHAKLVKRDGKP